MRQLEQDYLDLSQKYRELKKHSARNNLAMCLLIQMFPRDLSELKNDKHKEKLIEGVTLIMRGYFGSIIEDDLFDDLKKMQNTARSFFQELTDKKGGGTDFITNFINLTKNNHDTNKI